MGATFTLSTPLLTGVSCSTPAQHLMTPSVQNASVAHLDVTQEMKVLLLVRSYQACHRLSSSGYFIMVIGGEKENLSQVESVELVSTNPNVYPVPDCLTELSVPEDTPWGRVGAAGGLNYERKLVIRWTAAQSFDRRPSDSFRLTQQHSAWRSVSLFPHRSPPHRSLPHQSLAPYVYSAGL